MSLTQSLLRGAAQYPNAVKVFAFQAPTTVANATLLAANDLTATAANVSAGGTLTAAAGRNVVLNAAIDTSNLDQYHSPSDHTVAHTVSFDQTVKGTTFSGAQGVMVAAGLSDPTGSLTVAASNVTSANGNVTLSAAKDVNITSVGEEHDSTVTTTHTSSGFLSSSRTSTTDTVNTNTQIGSTISGNTVTIASGGDTNVLGSNVAATNGLTMAAGGNITIAAATDTDHEEHDYSHSQSGLFSSGGIGITIGSAKNSSTDTIDATAAAASTVGSANGNVVIAANDNVHITGSNVIAGSGNVAIVGQNVTIDAAKQTYNETQTYKASSSGLSIGLTGGIVSAGEGIAHAVTTATDSKDGRVQALEGIAGGLTAYNANDAGVVGGAKTGLDALSSGNVSDASAASGVQLSISIGGSSSSASQTLNTTTYTGSNIAAGNNLTVVATGNGANGALNVVGSSLSGTNVALAGNTFNLAAAENTSNMTSRETGSSGSLGVSIGSGGFTVDAAIAGSKGNGTSSSTAAVNTVVNATNTAIIVSTGDTTIAGAQVNANQVVADIGGNLTVQSLQDTSSQQASQQSAGLGVSIPIGAGAGGLSLSASSSNGTGQSATVTAPSGLFAGDGGFQVNVTGNTNLVGADITSSQQAANDNLNSLTTGTLTTSSLNNSASYNASSVGVSLSTSSLPNGNLTGFGLPLGDSQSSSQSSVTNSGVTFNSGAPTITITNPTGQNASQVVASLAAQSQGLTTDNAQARANALDSNPDVLGIVNSYQNEQAAGADATLAVGTTLAQDKAEQQLAARQNQQNEGQSSSQGTSSQNQQTAGTVLASANGNEGKPSVGEGNADGSGNGTPSAGKPNTSSTPTSAWETNPANTSTPNSLLDGSSGGGSGDITITGSQVWACSPGGGVSECGIISATEARSPWAYFSGPGTFGIAPPGLLTGSFQAFDDFSKGFTEAPRMPYSRPAATESPGYVPLLSEINERLGPARYAALLSNTLWDQQSNLNTSGENLGLAAQATIYRVKSLLGATADLLAPVDATVGRVSETRDRSRYQITNALVDSASLIAAGVGTAGDVVVGPRNIGFDASNLQSKLKDYLLNPAHPQNQSKADWFSQALGFNQSNWQDLASQLHFDPITAVPTKVTQYGQTYEQVISIIGANGKAIDTTFVFMKDNSGSIRLVTGIPAKK